MTEFQHEILKSKFRQAQKQIDNNIMLRERSELLLKRQIKQMRVSAYFLIAACISMFYSVYSAITCGG